MKISPVNVFSGTFTDLVCFVWSKMDILAFVREIKHSEESFLSLS